MEILSIKISRLRVFGRSWMHNVSGFVFRRASSIRWCNNMGMVQKVIDADLLRLNGGLLGQEIDQKVQAFYQFQPLIANASGIFPKGQSQCQVSLLTRMEHGQLSRIQRKSGWNKADLQQNKICHMERSQSPVNQDFPDETKPISSGTRLAGWNKANLQQNKI